MADGLESPMDPYDEALYFTGLYTSLSINVVLVLIQRIGVDLSWLGDHWPDQTQTWMKVANELIDRSPKRSNCRERFSTKKCPSQIRYVIDLIYSFSSIFVLEFKLSDATRFVSCTRACEMEATLQWPYNLRPCLFLYLRTRRQCSQTPSLFLKIMSMYSRGFPRRCFVTTASWHSRPVSTSILQQSSE